MSREFATRVRSAGNDNEESFYARKYKTDGDKRLRANVALLNQVGIPVVPTMLFQAKSGEAMVIQGALSPIALRKVLDRVR